METNFISSIIRRSNRNQLILWGIGLILVLVAIAFSANHFYNLIAGPFEVTPEYITDIDDVMHLDQFYVTVAGDRALDTGFNETRTSNGVETSKSYYKGLRVGGKLLLVKTGDLANTYTYTGALQVVPPDEQSEVLDVLLNEYPNFLPFMLDATDFKGAGYAGLAATVIGLLVCLWGVLKSLSRILNQERHPIWRNLQRFGEPSSMADQIETELSSSAETVGNAQVTRNWLVAAQKSTLDVAQLKDIVWIYKKIVNGRGGKRISALIYDRHGHLTTINGKETKIDETLRGIAQRVPWVMIGYSKETQTAWNKDRDGFIRSVDQRRQQTNQ